MDRITGSFATASYQPVLLVYNLVELYFSGSTVNLFNGTGEISVLGTTYYGTGTCGSISTIVEDGATTAKGIELKLSGVPSTELAYAFEVGSEYKNRPVKVKLACFHSASMALLGVNTVFVGRMDTFTVNESGPVGAITIAAENHLIDLQRARLVTYSHAYQQSLYPDDTGLEFITTIQDVQVPWGKKSNVGYSGGTYGGNYGGTLNSNNGNSSGIITNPYFGGGDPIQPVLPDFPINDQD